MALHPPQPSEGAQAPPAPPCQESPLVLSPQKKAARPARAACLPQLAANFSSLAASKSMMPPPTRLVV